MANPTLVQHVATPSTLAVDMNPITSLVVSFPNPVLAGNLIIAAVQHDKASGGTVSCADDQTQSYTKIDNTAGANQSCHLFYFLNSAAGVKKVTISFTTETSYVNVVLAEFYNVATSSADVTSAIGGATSTVWQAVGTIAASATGETPYLVYHVAFSASTTAQASFAAQSGFQLACAQLPGTSGLGSLPTATQWRVATAGITNPTITAGTSREYSSIAVAFKSAAAGTAPTLTPRVVNVQYNEFDSASTVHLQFPCIGNVLVASIVDNLDPNDITVTSITDSNDNTWQDVDGSPAVNGGAGQQQMMYAEGVTPSTDLSLTVTYTGTVSGANICFQDIVGANSYVTGTAASGTKNTTGNLPSVSITPTAAGQLVLGHCDHAEGTETGCVVDGNGHTPNFQTPYWGGENGNAISYFCHDSGQANFLTTETSAVQFIWSRSATAPGDWVALAGIFEQSGESSPIERNLAADSLNGGTVRF